MIKAVFKSDRYFVVYDYFVSHRQFLLRSVKDGDSEKNIDIIFFDTSYIKGPTNYKGVVISKLVDLSALRSIRSDSDTQGNVFTLKDTSSNIKTYIVASMVKVYENDLEFNETSLGLFGVIGRDTEVFSLGNE